MEHECSYIDKTDESGISYRIRKNDNICIRYGEFGINDLVKIKETVTTKYGYIFYKAPLSIIEPDPYDALNLVIKCCPTNLKANLVNENPWIWMRVGDLEIVKRFDPTESINKLVKKIKKIETENNKNNK